MLSQRIVLYALLSAQGESSGLTVAGEALELFRASHMKLLRAREGVPPSAASALQEAFFGPHGADAPIREFTPLAEETLNAVATGGAGARRLLPCSSRFSRTTMWRGRYAAFFAAAFFAGTLAARGSNSKLTLPSLAS